MNRADLDRFYALIGELRRRVGGERYLRDCTRRSGWPGRGVYFFFEAGKVRPDGTPRVVRVGTHALKDGSLTTLWTHLAQHRGQDRGRWLGGGNHRGSIFRHHVGEALLARQGDPESIGPSWARRGRGPSDVRDLEHRHEVDVSDHIRSLPFLWVGIDDPPGPGSDRGIVEANAIALLSARSNSHSDPPSDRWLGRHARRDAIRSSGLWNINHVDGPFDPVFLDVLEPWTTGPDRSAC